MAIGIIGRKIGMTQILNPEEGKIPVTVIEAGPCQVLQTKVVEKDGYNAVQLGFHEIKAKKVNKPLAGHFKKSGNKFYRYVTEFREDDIANYKTAQTIKVDIFKTGDYVDVISFSKGKGFAGTMKRHNFGGGPATHGSMFHRAPGSIGESAYPARVIKGRKMPGHMGSKRVTIQNLRIVEIDKKNNILIVRGAVPGAKSSIIYVNTSIKKKVKAAPAKKSAK